MKLHVIVTAAHIQRGERGECVRCPVARAIHDLGYRQAVVRWSGIAPTYADDDLLTPKRIPLPDVVSKFIHTFDCGGSVEPFEFDIENWPDVV